MDELLISVQTPSPKGHIGIPCLVWGMPGTGKSSFVESLQNEDFPVFTLIASIHDPTDFSGLPVLTNGKVDFAPPSWAAAFAKSGEGLLFLDELSTAPPAVQAALLRVVLERRVGSAALPHGVRVVAAANPPEVAASGWELSQPLCNRFVHLDWDFGGLDYARALNDGFSRPKLPHIDGQAHTELTALWSMHVSNFLRRNPALVSTQAGDGEFAFASPRTWDFAIRLMASCDLMGLAPKMGTGASASFVRLVSGAIGSGASKPFTEHIRRLSIPDPDEALDGEVPALSDLREDEIFAFFTGVVASLVRRISENQTGLTNVGLKFMQMIDQVNNIGKVDAMFVPVRQAVRGAAIQRLLVAARTEKRLGEFEKAMNKAIKGTGLEKFMKTLK